MRANFIRMTSTSGGTGTMTCTAQTGYPIVSEAFTGVRFIEYAIAEYTDSTKVTLSKAETGIGSYNTSTEVLTRTSVLSTWDGTDYLPKYGTSTAPTALNFGTTSANIDIMIAPMAGGVMPPQSFIAGTVASVSDGTGHIPLNYQNIGANALTVTHQQVRYFPVLIGHTRMYSQFTVRQVGATTGGSPTADCAIYEFGSDGLPGKRLISFTQKAVGSANTTYTSTALATPIPLICGWYWAGFLWQNGGGSGGTFRSGPILGGGVAPLLTFSTNMSGVLTLASQSALNDPATAATAIADSTNAAPVITFK